MRAYRVGHESIADLGDLRTVRIAMRTGLIAYRALTPSAVVGRLAMAIAKPPALAAVLAVASPERAVLAAATGLGGLVCSAWERPAGQSWPDRWRSMALIAERGGANWDASRWVLAIAAGAAAVIALWLAKRAWSPATGAPRSAHRSPVRPLVAAGLLVAGLVLAAVGVRLGPVTVTVLAALVAWFGTFWMRAVWRVAVALGTGALYAGAALLAIPIELSVGWWIALSGVAAAYALTLVASVFDVLPPRPGRQRGR